MCKKDWSNSKPKIGSLFPSLAPEALPDGKASCNLWACEGPAGDSQNRSFMADGELKLKSAIDSTGGGISVGSNSEDASGVVTSLAEHESSEDSRMRFEDDSDEGE